MKIVQVLGFSLLVLLSACAPPAGYKYDAGVFTPKLIDPCTAADAPAQLVALLNQRIGGNKAPSSKVIDIKTVKYPGHADIGKTYLYCHVDIMLENGETEAGNIEIVAPDKRDKEGKPIAYWIPDISKIDKEKNKIYNEKLDYCLWQSWIYAFAADGRDQGVTPQQLFKARFMIIDGKWHHIPEPQIKAIINVVYFDSMFAGQHSQYLQREMMNLCLNPPKHYDPLK